MYSNCYGLDGVTKLIQILKTEIAADAAQAGIADLQNVSPSIVSYIPSPHPVAVCARANM